MKISAGVLNYEKHSSKYDFKAKEVRICVVLGIIWFDCFGLINQVVVHPDYNSDTITNDVGLIKLDRPIQFDGENSNCSRACLPLSPSEIKVNMSGCYTLGWGSTSLENPTSDLLVKVQMPILDGSACKSVFPTFNETLNICAGYMKGGAGPCFYDNGGPLACPLIIPNSIEVIYTVVGMLTRTDDCAKPQRPALFTNISVYKDFLLKNTG